VILLFPAHGSYAAVPPLEQLVAKTQENYNNVSDLKATFTQETTVKSMNKTEREEGVVYFKNPRRMLWDYRKPKEKKLIINSEKAWLYMPSDHTAYVQDSEKIFRSKLAVRFLSGIGKLQDDFLISYPASQSTDGAGNYLLVLTPKEDIGGIEKLTLTISRDNYQILGCRFTDAFGNATNIHFKSIKINSSLSDKLFSFKPPAGVDVFNMP
ncbi:MAG: outer membrane lipoprotein carrier protein LolA, partial [Smithellaceae bacterium]|nr:outer membrane lipoprotein carrier protein LolA [Smithellaceae bacterium]